MPIEIIELTVKATISEHKGPSSELPENPTSSSRDSDDKDLIIQEAVEKVLEILKRERER